MKNRRTEMACFRPFKSPRLHVVTRLLGPPGGLLAADGTIGCERGRQFGGVVPTPFGENTRSLKKVQLNYND